MMMSQWSGPQPFSVRPDQISVASHWQIAAFGFLTRSPLKHSHRYVEIKGMSGQHVPLLFNHLHPKKKKLSSQGTKWSTSAQLLSIRRRREEVRGGGALLVRAKRASGHEREPPRERPLLPYKETFQRWNWPNVYSHIPIKITKSFHHFCFK